MQTDTQRIEEQRARIVALDSTLDSKRTPFLKRQLLSASHRLDDATDALRYAEKAHSTKDAAMWRGFAETNIQAAVQFCQKVQEAVELDLKAKELA